MLRLMHGRTGYQVKEVARMSGVSVRALHHYDEIGLLVPSARSSAKYRLYDDDDLLRLQQILIGRELGLSLEQIRRSLDDPHFDRKQALVAQREELRRRAARLDAMIRAIDRALGVVEGAEKKTRISNEQHDGGMMPDDRTDIFEGFDPGKYDTEVRDRWRNTDAYTESKRRTKKYTQEDWSKFRDEQKAIYRDMWNAQRAGKKPGDDDVMEIAERARLCIDRWFYPCPPSVHAQLADLYEADSRFAANIDAFGEGLTTFLAAAIRANSRYRGGESHT